MEQLTSPSTRTLGRLGVAGPLAFTVAWMAAGSLQDDYDPRREYISALASQTARSPWLMIGGFLLGGAALVALSAGVRRAYPERRAGAWALALVGACIAADGMLRQDCSTARAACAAADPSWHAVAHDLLALAIFASLVAAPLLLRMDRAVAAVGLLLLLAVGAEPVPEIAGIVQRVFVTVMLGWVALVGLRVAGWTPGRESASIPA